MKEIINWLKSYKNPLASNDKLKVSGEVSLKIYKNNVLVEDSIDKNLVVTLGRTNLANLLGGGDGFPISAFRVGTNATAPSAGDTSITDSFDKAITTTTYPSAGQVQFNFSLETSEANGINIAEFGLFDSDDIMFARKTRAPIAKTSDIRIEGTWKIIF
jgi:hypothetical protein